MKENECSYTFDDAIIGIESVRTHLLSLVSRQLIDIPHRLTESAQVLGKAADILRVMKKEAETEAQNGQDA